MSWIYQRQLLLRNLKNIPRLALEEHMVNETVGAISVSELKSVKGFWEATITKLVSMWLNTVAKLAKAIEQAWEDNAKIQAILTFPQLKQFKTHLSENPLLITD